MQGEEGEEKEQCSPVSVLDPPFDEEDDEHESRDAEEDDEGDEDDYEMECSYENVQSMLLSLPKFLPIINYIFEVRCSVGSVS